MVSGMNSRNPEAPDSKVNGGTTRLSLGDTQRAARLPLKTAGGYNPYDAVPRGKTTGRPTGKRKNPTDLRKLSEWIRRHREIDELNDELNKKDS